jgi:hypothetical protein
VYTRSRPTCRERGVCQCLAAAGGRRSKVHATLGMVHAAGYMPTPLQRFPPQRCAAAAAGNCERANVCIGGSMCEAPAPSLPAHLHPCLPAVAVGVAALKAVHPREAALPCKSAAARTAGRAGTAVKRCCSVFLSTATCAAASSGRTANRCCCWQLGAAGVALWPETAGACCSVRCWRNCQLPQFQMAPWDDAKQQPSPQ